MTAFEQITIGKNCIPALVLTIILLIGIPAAAILFWWGKHRKKLRFRYLIAGAVGFIVSARVLESGVHYLCLIMDSPVSRFLNGSTAAYVIYGITMAGVFEEVGRYIILKYIMKKQRTRENAVLYGIGHGGIEILTVVLPLIATYLAFALFFSSGNLESALSALQITEENAQAALPVVQAAASYDYPMAAVNVMERVMAILLHVGLSVIVYYSVASGKKRYLLLAVLLHMTADVFAGLYQAGAASVWAAEGWFAVCMVIVLVIAAKLYRQSGKLRPEGQVS